MEGEGNEKERKRREKGWGEWRCEKKTLREKIRNKEGKRTRQTEERKRPTKQGSSRNGDEKKTKTLIREVSERTKKEKEMRKAQSDDKHNKKSGATQCHAKSAVSPYTRIRSLASRSLSVI